RSLEFGDIDGNGSVDMIAPANENARTRVWINRCGTLLSCNPSDPFLLEPGQPDLQWPAPSATTYECSCCSPTVPITPVPALPSSTFACALPDLDLDGDLDLVTANNASPNAAYFNNGSGYFGSFNLGGGTNDGVAAFVFPAVTPTYVGASNALDFIYGLNSTPTCHYTWTLPGEETTRGTDVSVADCNGDGMPDVAFSNRNDLELGLDPFPDCYDHLFFDASTPTAIAFDPAVELLGLPNDGTGYGELEDLNGGSGAPSGD